MNAIELGKFISQLRNEKHITQDELAEKLNVSSGKVISKWENGYATPDFNTLIKLSKILDVTLFELSICQRLEKPSLIEATKTRLKSIKDITKLNILKKITIVITILLGIFFGLTAIFTIKYYNQITIYKLVSLDKDFYIQGNFINAKNYKIFNITNLGYVGNNKEELNISAYNIEYEIMNDNKSRIFYYIDQSTKTKTNKTILLNKINSTHFSSDTGNTDLTFEKKYNFIISYRNMNNDYKSISFNIKVEKIFNDIL